MLSGLFVSGTVVQDGPIALAIAVALVVALLIAAAVRRMPRLYSALGFTAGPAVVVLARLIAPIFSGA